MFSHSEIVELRGNGSILLIGRPISFGQLNRFDARMCGSIDDPQRIADRVRHYVSHPGNGLKLRHFWLSAGGGNLAPRNEQDMVRDVGRIVGQGAWMALEIADERRVGCAVPEKISGRMTPVLSTLKGRNVATMSMDEKFELTFEKVPNYLGEDVAESFRNLVSPVALGVSAASLGLMIVVSDGVIIPVMVALGYALLGSAIFTIIGDLINAIQLVANATDDQDLEQAAALFARVTAEVVVTGLITLVTLGAGRIGARMGKGGRGSAEGEGAFGDTTLRQNRQSGGSTNRDAEFRENLDAPKHENQVSEHIARERPSTGFKGRKGHELKNSAYQKTRNSDGVISGREYSGHALDQMQNRGIMSSSVENAVKFGKRSADPIPGRVRYVDMENKVTVITENEKVITVMRGAR